MKISTHYNDLFVDLYHYQGRDEDAIKARLRLGDTTVATVNGYVQCIKMEPSFANIGIWMYAFNRCTTDKVVIESKPGIYNPLESRIIIKSKNQLIFK